VGSLQAHLARRHPQIVRRHRHPKWGTYYAHARSAFGRNGGTSVKKVEEYLGHASECRTLARAAPSAHRQQLEDMARTWERLAKDRVREVQKHFQVKTC